MVLKYPSLTLSQCTTKEDQPMITQTANGHSSKTPKSVDFRKFSYFNVKRQLALVVLISMVSVYVMWDLYLDKLYNTDLYVILAVNVSQTYPPKCKKPKGVLEMREMPEDPRWYKVPENAVASNPWVLSIVAAFYDYRIDKVVILMASNAASLIEDGKLSFSFKCAILYDNASIMAFVDGYFFTSYIFYCPLPNNVRIGLSGTKSFMIPEAVSLSRNDSKQDSVNWTIPVTNLLERKILRKSKSIKNLALCVGILFGFQDWISVLQYIEFHRMQGVQKFFFFYTKIYPSVADIFRWYSKEVPSLIETVHWEPQTSVCDGGEYKCQLVRDNYCSYSLMHRYKYVGNNDFDELFYPTNMEKQQNLIELLNSVDRPSRGSFTFRAKYHQHHKNDTPAWEDLNSANISDVAWQFLPLVHFTNVSTLAAHYYSPKTITKPETVIKRWIHYVQDHVKGSGIYHLLEEEGFLRHFKFRNWWGGWAEQADTMVTYQIKNPIKEIGNDSLSLMQSVVADVARKVKLSVENGWKTEDEC